MLSAGTPAPADAGPDYQRHVDRAAEHEAPFGRVVDQLIHAEQEKVGTIMEVNGTQAGDGGANGYAGQGAFG